jgi:hypothetical protein
MILPRLTPMSCAGSNFCRSPEERNRYWPSGERRCGANNGRARSPWAPAARSPAVLPAGACRHR